MKRCNHCKALQTHCICSCNGILRLKQGTIAPISSKQGYATFEESLAQIEAMEYRDLTFSRDQAIVALWVFERLLPTTIAGLKLEDLHLPSQTLRVKGLLKFIRLNSASVHYLTLYLQDRLFLSPTHHFLFVSKLAGQPISSRLVQNLVRVFGYVPRSRDE